MTTSISIEQRAKIFAALADPTRLRFVELLAASDEMSGSEVAEKLSISLALMCHHSKAIVDIGLAKSAKTARQPIFRWIKSPDTMPYQLRLISRLHAIIEYSIFTRLAPMSVKLLISAAAQAKAMPKL